MTLAAGLIASRFAHYAALMLLFGAALFPLYAFRENERAPLAALVNTRLRTPLLLAAVVALVSGVSWLLFTSGSMSGSLAGAVDIGVIRNVIRETEFGQVWVWRLGLAVVLFLLALPSQTSDTLSLARIGASTLLLTSIAGTGHAGADASALGTFHVANDSLHLLTAAAWLGGLAPLAIVISRRPQPDIPATVDILQRFSGMAMLAVAALVASGLINSWFQIGGVQSLVTTPYGRWLALKIGLFLAMLSLAYANRNRLVPALASGPVEPGLYLNKLRGNVLAEQILGLLVLAVVSLLGTLSPPGG